MLKRLCLTSALCLFPIFAQAQVDTIEVLAFDVGATSGTVDGTITGWQTRDYLVGAVAGQTMTVELISDMTASVNVAEPGETDFFYIGSETYDPFAAVTLQATGDFRIRVLMRGEDADSGRKGPFTLTVTITD